VRGNAGGPIEGQQGEWEREQTEQGVMGGSEHMTI
jgi:hypothetical protein